MVGFMLLYIGMGIIGFSVLFKLNDILKELRNISDKISAGDIAKIHKSQNIEKILNDWDRERNIGIKETK